MIGVLGVVFARWSLLQFLPITDPNDPCQFQIDEDLDAYFDTWKEAFIYLLIKDFAEFRSFGIYEPDEVKAFTKEYQNESDYFTQFFDECIVTCENSTVGITLNDIIAVYQDWFPKNIGTNIQMPKRKDIKTNIIVRNMELQEWLKVVWNCS